MSSQAILWMIKGAIHELPAEDHAKVYQCIAQIKGCIAAAGEHGAFALALVGAEAALATDQADAAG